VFTLDTNILIGYLNDDKKVADRLLAWRKVGKKFFISVITEIEILSFPFLTQEEIVKIQRFLQEFTIIPLDTQLALMAAGIRRNSKIKLGDSVVIATAKLTNSVLVSLDKDVIKKAGTSVKVQSIPG
jgi:predicted nucleic acid-binding protein